MRRFFRALLIFFALLGFLAAYLYLYLFPALEGLNRLRRQATDFRRQLGREAALVQTTPAFSEKEEQLLQAWWEKVKNVLFVDSSQADENAFLGTVTASLRQLAAANGISDLTLTPAFLPVDPQRDFEGADGKKLIARQLQLDFVAPAEASWGLIRACASLPYRLRLEALTLQPRSNGLYWKLVLQACGRGPGFTHIAGTRFNLDIDSPMLLQPIAEPAPEADDFGACPMDAWGRFPAVKK